MLYEFFNSLYLYFRFQCHKKLEMALEAQHSKLQNTLEELKSYQTQHASWSHMNTKLYSVQAPLESRVSCGVLFL